MAIQHLVSLMSKELLNVKWHKIQSCWCENLSSKILIFVKKSQVFVKLDGLNYKWSQPWTEISSVTFFISTSKKTSTASFLYKLFLIYHCTLIKYFIQRLKDWLWKKLYYSCFVTRFHKCFWSYQIIEKQLLRTKELLTFFDDQDDHKTWAEKISFFSSTCDKMAAFWLTNLH